MVHTGGGVSSEAGQEPTAGRFNFSPEPTLEDIKRSRAEFPAERDLENFPSLTCS